MHCQNVVRIKRLDEIIMLKLRKMLLKRDKVYISLRLLALAVLFKVLLVMKLSFCVKPDITQPQVTYRSFYRRSRRRFIIKTEFHKGCTQCQQTEKISLRIQKPKILSNPKKFPTPILGIRSLTTSLHSTRFQNGGGGPINR